MNESCIEFQMSLLIVAQSLWNVINKLLVYDVFGLPATILYRPNIEFCRLYSSKLS